MKKLLLIVVCCLYLVGCSNSKIQHSNFKWKKSGSLYPLYYATGSIKNNSSKYCNIIYIDLIYSNGNLKENDNCSNFSGIKSGESISIECMYTGDLDNIEDYEITIDKIECSN